MQIEHEPWLPEITGGVQGQRIAIVGYSHYVDDYDRASLTKEVMRCVIESKCNFQFFRSIQSYFGCSQDPDFWNRVIFFNFLPDAIGPKSEKYMPGSAEQLERGRDRFLRIINNEKPEKVFAFTSKGWRAFPETTLEEISGDGCKPLIEGQTNPNWGTYKADSTRVLVCGFRHPQFARNTEMKEQVDRFLQLRPQPTPED